MYNNNNASEAQRYLKLIINKKTYINIKFRKLKICSAVSAV